MMGGYIMPEKHDQTAESRAGVLGQKKKNFFSSFTYTGWGELLNVQEINFFFSSAYTGWGELHYA